MVKSGSPWTAGRGTWMSLAPTLSYNGVKIKNALHEEHEYDKCNKILLVDYL
jgi:hypothetical protein